jgi:hypothetical protein
MLINHPFDILAINKTKLDYFRLGNIHKWIYSYPEGS